MSMKRILIILIAIGFASTAKAQFPTTDSLRSFINRYIRNSAVEAFQNLRLNTALIGMTNYLDSAYGGQVVSFTAPNDTTARIITLAGDTLEATIVGRTSTITLTNVGTGYRWVATSGGNIKTAENTSTIVWDSTTTTLRARVDTTNIATQYDLTQIASSDTFTLGRNLEAIDDTLKTKDTLISATPDLSENSTKVATTEWVKDQAYGTGSGSAAGSTGDVQFKGVDGLFKAAPSSRFVWDSTNARLKIGNPSVANNRVEVEGNVNVNNGSIKIDDGNMLNINGGTELRIGEAGFVGAIGIRTGGTQRIGISSSVIQVAPPLDVATTIRVGGVDIIKDMDPELQIGSGGYWKKIRIVNNGATVGYWDTARFAINNTAPKAMLHITPAGTGQYQGGFILDSTGAPIAQKWLMYNRGDHLYWYDNNLVSHQLDGGGSTYTFTNGLTESSGTVKLGGTLTENTTVNTGGFTTEWTGANDNETSLTVSNTGTTSASAILGAASGTTSTGVTGTSSQYIGVFGSSTSNTGVQGQSSSGVGVIGVSSTGAGLRGQINATSTNAIENVLTLLRTTSAGAGANGIGAAIQYELETATSGTSQIAGLTAFKWSDATNATRTSDFDIYTVNSGTSARKFSIKGNGQLVADTYGAGTHSVTPATTPVIASDGTVGERVAPKIYTALLSQSGAGAPTAIVLGTNEIGSIVWTRSSAGVYAGTLTGAFTSNKTWLIAQQGDQIGSFVNTILSWTSANAVALSTSDNLGNLTDGFSNISIEIRVYP
jgi:hypothetical protein